MSSTNVSLNKQRKDSKGTKGEVTIFEDAGRLKVNLPRQYFAGKQIKKSLGLKATPENWSLATRIAKRLTLDLQENKFKEDSFDKILAEYGIKLNLKLINASSQLPPKSNLNTLEIWEKYLTYKKASVKETTYVLSYERIYTPAIKAAIEANGDNPIEIRNWLLSNRCLNIAKNTLSQLDHAYSLAVKHGVVFNNLFDGMTDELPKASQQKVNVHEDEDDSNLYDSKMIKKKAFTQDEITSILDYVKSSKGKHYHPILSFLFLTGCRTGEAIGFMYGDIKWDKEYIVFQRTYSAVVNKFVSTKTGHIRLFPMPKNGELWNLLKSMNEGKPNEVVFASKTDKIMHVRALGRFWQGSSVLGIPGVINKLIEQGKVTKYLPLYNTRHTFISYQINECGIPPHVVKDWCGHSEDMTTRVYRQEDFITKPVDYGKNSVQETPQVNSQQLQIQALEKQNLMLQQQLTALQELVASLQKQ